jgi:hypothetical protein
LLLVKKSIVLFIVSLESWLHFINVCSAAP